METGPVQAFVNLMPVGSDAPETHLEQAQQSFEETTFFAAHFKDYTVKPMPDLMLMQRLFRAKCRHKLRQVAKKEKAEGLAMRKPKDKQSPEDDPNSV